ncbi:MAG: DUF4437 domain-containing protein, partial [Phycisphaerales bacterium]
GGGAPALPPGAMLRVLSDDPLSGAMTAILELPAFFSTKDTALACSSDLQLFLLDGDLWLGEDRLGPGGYCFHPAGSPHGDWYCETTVRALLILGAHASFAPTRSLTKHPRAIAAIDSWALQWIDPLAASDPSTTYRTGVMVKMLREDPDTGSTTHLAGLMPGWFMPGLEVHPVIEENYCLSGDVHIGLVDGEPGYTMTEGVYLCRPPGIAHGPILSKNGNVNFCYTHGRLGIDYRESPQSETLIRNHLQNFPWR